MERHPWLLPSRPRATRPGDRDWAGSHARPRRLPSWAGCSSASWPTSSARTGPSSTRTFGRCSGGRQRRRAGRRTPCSSSPISGGTFVIVAGRARLVGSNTRVCPNQVGAPVPPHGRRREILLVNTIKGSWTAFARPSIRRGDPRAVVPERTLGLGGGVLRRGCARARPPPLTANPRTSRGWRVAIAVGVACSRVLSASTGCPTSSQGSPSAGRGSASARSRSAGASSCSARRSSRRRRSPTDRSPRLRAPVSASSGQTS